jgi:hypothetical protein
MKNNWKKADVVVAFSLILRKNASLILRGKLRPKFGE